MANYFSVDAVDKIDMVNTVFNYYLPDVTITGGQNMLDQDEETTSTLRLGDKFIFSLGELTKINKIYAYGTNVNYLSFYTTSDYGNTWSSVYTTNGSQTEAFINVSDNITGFKFLSNKEGEEITVYRAAAFVDASAQEGLVIRDEYGTVITGIDFGTATLNSTNVKKIEIYSNVSYLDYDNIKIYEVKDNLNTSNTYLSFSQELSGVYTDHALNISGHLYGNSGIYTYVKLNTPSNANFGNYTAYIRVVANEYFME